MQKLLFTALLSLFLLRGGISAQNIYESIGKTTEVLTLSQGKYQEFFPNDTLVRIGNVLFNTITNEVVEFVSSANTVLAADVASRFLSVDPIARQYPELTPYQFASNMPIAAIDLDGLEAYLFINAKQIQAIFQFQCGPHMNIRWVSQTMSTFQDVATYLHKQYEDRGAKAKVVYITMHGSPGQVYTDPGANNVIDTEPCRSVNDCPPNDDDSFGGAYVIDNYIDYRKKNTEGFVEGSKSMPRIELLKKVMDEIQDNGTLILGGCNIGYNSPGGNEGDETLEALNRLAAGRINIIVNHDLTTETTSIKGTDGTNQDMFLDAGRTGRKNFDKGWKMIGPATGGKILNTNKDLQLNSQNELEKCYEFIDGQN